MSNEQIERRLAAVEAEVAEIRRQLAEPEPAREPDPETGDLPASGPDWLKRITGSMKDFPEFEDLLRYGREYRESDRPAGEDE
jgi:hypothetical protein